MNSLIESIVASIQENIALLLIVLGVIYVVYVISLAVIFKKVGNKAIYAFIPIYNVLTLLSILRIPRWMALIMFIPFVNIIGFMFMSVIMGYKLGVLCRKNILMKIGLMFLSPIFYPLLAFTDIDVDGSKLDYVIEQPKKVEFKLEPVEITAPIDAPEAMNLSSAENVDKITIKKLKPTVEIKKTDPNVSVAEHLAKANKERPTAQDLTFDYNLIYNSKEVKDNKVEEAVKEIAPQPVQEGFELDKDVVETEATIVEEVSEPVVEEEVDDTPIVPVIHEVFLEEAAPIDESSVGPIAINQRYDKQINANKEQLEKKKELERAKAKEAEESIIQVIEPTVIIDNGPINVDSTLSGLVAAAPDFTLPVKSPSKEAKIEAVEPIPIVDTPIATEAPQPVVTTDVQEIVSMNIVEPDQMPVFKTIKEEVSEVSQPEPVQPVVQQVVPTQPQGPVFIINPVEPQPSLLRPVATTMNDNAQIDKTCPSCNAKMRRDCPVCFICGYKFPG